MTENSKHLIYSPRDSLVMTERGLIAISKIKEGEMILTSKGKFAKVVTTKVETSQLVTISGHGFPKLMITETQPIPVSNYKRKKASEDSDMKTERVFFKPELKESKDIKGDFWLSPSRFPKIEEPIELTDDLTWFMGAFLGGGYLRKDFKIYIKATEFRYKELEDILNRLSLKFQTSFIAGYIEYYIDNPMVYDFFQDTFHMGFGQYNVPIWMYGMDERYRKQLFEGYIWGDGVFEDNKYRSTTGNKHIAVGMKLISQTLGNSVALYVSETYKEQKRIEKWQTVSELVARSSVEIDGYRYGLVRDISEPSKRAYKVWVLEFDSPQNIIIDGIMVRTIKHK